MTRALVVLTRFGMAGMAAALCVSLACIAAGAACHKLGI